MTEIEFSYIRDVDADDSIWAAIIEDFKAQTGINVRIRTMNWDSAWVELFSFGSNDKGSHVSHVGNTWITSLAKMNVLRPFKPEEIASVGGAWDFITSNWEMGIMPGDRRIWAIPWTGWIYATCYRKDLLEQVGIDPAEAFSTPTAARTTVYRLVSSSLEVPWLTAKLPASSRSLLHIAASWIWSAGGDFFDKTATKATFNSPPAIDGLKDWIEMYRAVPAQYKNLNQPEVFDVFSSGRAAGLMTDIRFANLLMNLEENPTVRDNLGVASLADIPWTGGGSLVIWDYTRSNTAQEKAAVELVKFLANRENNVRYCQATGSMPSRMDALHEMYPPGNPARDAIMVAATKGRNYNNNIPSWRRIEQQLSDAMGAIIQTTIDDPSVDSVTLLHSHLDGLAERVTNLLR